MMNVNHMLELHDALLELLPNSPFVADDLALMVGDTNVRAFYVRPETMFDADSVYERVVAFVVTDTHLHVFYTDTNYEMEGAGELVTTIQSVSLATIVEHHVIRRRQLEGEHVGRLNSVLLKLRWGASRTVDVHPGSCDDPSCMNDHGYVGMVTNDDFHMFLEQRHDGEYFQPGVAFIESVLAILKARS